MAYNNSNKGGKNNKSWSDRLKDYVQVHERIVSFYKDHPDGSIQCEIEHLEWDKSVLMRAYVYRYPEDPRPATGYAAENNDGSSVVNTTSMIENCETSAVGRALAMLGYEVKKGIASREEMEKALRREKTKHENKTVEELSKEDPSFKKKMDIYGEIKREHERLNAINAEDKKKLLEESGIVDSFNELDTIELLTEYLNFLKSKETPVDGGEDSGPTDKSDD